MKRTMLLATIAALIHHSSPPQAFARNIGPALSTAVFRLRAIQASLNMSSSIVYFR